MASGAMEKLKDRVQTTELAATPVGQNLLEQGATMRQMRLDNYVTAVAIQKPRDKKMVIKEVEFEAELLGEQAYYSWTAKGKGGRALIEGPSIDLAMVLMREWGNCASRADLVVETPTHFLFDGIFLDLERGVTVVRQFRQVKARDMGRMDEDRTEDIVFQIGQSKAIRNAICAAMPSWLITKALKKAKASAAKDLTPDRVIEAFRKWDVDQKALERRTGKAAKRWDDMDMAELRGVYQALLDGMTTIDNEFGVDKAAVDVADAVSAKAEPEKPAAEPEKPAAVAAKAESEKPEPVAAEPEKTEAEQEKKVTVVKKDENGVEHEVGLPTATKKALEAFGELAITKEQLEAKMEATADKWGRAELNKLKAMIRSIKEGDVEKDTLFPPPAGNTATKDDGGEWE